MKGKRVLLGLVCLVLSVLTGCGEKPRQPAGGPSVQEEGTQIGITFDSFVIERWQRDRDVFVSTAQELGAEVNVPMEIFRNRLHRSIILLRRKWM